MLKLTGRNGKSKLLARAGFYLLILIILIWVSSLMLSLFLLLQSDIDSVVNSAKIPASALEKLYYSGYILSTLGIGDFTPSNNLWRIITDLYSFTGLILITMSVTYFIPVLSAIIKQRKLGINLSSLGNSPQEIILNAWNGKDYNFFTLQLLSLSDALLEHNQNHKAYPVIHFFHNNDKEHSVILQITRLHEAICILDNYLSPEYSMPKQEISTIKTALNNYIKVIGEVSNINFRNSSPITPDLNMLKEKNMLMPNSNSFNFSEDVQQDRQFFLALVVNDGWEWKDVL